MALQLYFFPDWLMEEYISWEQIWKTFQKTKLISVQELVLKVSTKKLPELPLDCNKHKPCYIRVSNNYILRRSFLMVNLLFQ